MNIAVTGSSNGLGKEIAHQLAMGGHKVIGVDYEFPETNRRFPTVHGDLSYPEHIIGIRNGISACLDGKALDVLINCAGINQIGWMEDFTIEQWDVVMNTNTRAIFLLSQALLPQLINSKGTILNIISNASHMPMTCSAAYNASKGAAHILTLQMARELTKRFGITVFGISPNKMQGTEMSSYIERTVPDVRGWTPEQAEAYQKQALLTGEETPPNVIANFISYLMEQKENHKYLSGCIIPYGA